MRLLILGLVFGLPVFLFAQETAMTSQKMEAPIIINHNTVNQLFVLDGIHADTLKEFQPGSTLKAKRFWLTHLKAGDKIQWHVFNNKKARFEIAVLANAKTGTAFKISCAADQVIVKSKEENWQRAVSNELISIPPGNTVVAIEVLKSAAPVDLKSIELVDSANETVIQKRIKAFKGDDGWMKNAGYGIMVQGGGWSYPPHGEKKPWPGFAEDFDAKKFVNKVYEMGGTYIVWSATWIDYLFPSPIKAIGEILPNRISKRDLIGDLIAECKKKNIRFMLYYHLGHGSKEVLLAKGWKDTPEQDSTSRQDWLNREEKILREIGERYGSGLDGIFLDDGCVWYPADFEKIGKAAKAGNPKRLLAYNSWIAPSLTPFQDFYCGEGFDGSKTPFKLNNGIIESGPQKGLQLFGCFVLDGPDWGIYKPNTIIQDPKNWTIKKIVDLNEKLHKEKYTIAFNLLMYEDGRFNKKSFDLLRQAAREIRKR